MAIKKKTQSSKKIDVSNLQTTIEVGQKAPSFTLLDQDENPVSLSDFKGKNILLYFYPKALTPGCTTQACELTSSQKEFEKRDIVTIGISADPPAKLKKFQEKYHLNFPLLSDPDKKVISSYGSWGLKKFMGKEFEGILRQSFFINKKGKIFHILHKVKTKTHHQDALNIFDSEGL